MDGRTFNGYVTLNTRNWYNPVMYYLAVMDCDDEAADILGDNINGRLKIDWWLTAGGSEYSYDM